ncbi:MAG: CcmD family protein [Ferruginibacter sp.]|nr:CcmD family protein [Bacteroidota bacterium]MCW5917159.1 CcmD family protein [Ferruginibacter sp.]
MVKKIVFSFLFACLAFIPAMAQEKVEMADVMRSNGKIYVVVAVCLTILLGLFAYMFYIDRKISKIEKHKSH